MDVVGDASWARQANERYQQDIAKRRQSFEERQRWLFRHRDREVMYHGRRYVIRLRRRHRSFRDAGAVWLQWLLHGLRNLVGDAARLVLRRQSHWSVGILDAGHPLIPMRAVDVRHYSSEEQAIAEADRLAEEVGNLGPLRKPPPSGGS
jgi:hypothetical protein